MIGKGSSGPKYLMASAAQQRDMEQHRCCSYDGYDVAPTMAMMVDVFQIDYPIKQDHALSLDLDRYQGQIDPMEFVLSDFRL